MFFFVVVGVCLFVVVDFLGVCFGGMLLGFVLGFVLGILGWGVLGCFLLVCLFGFFFWGVVCFLLGFLGWLFLLIVVCCF